MEREIAELELEVEAVDAASGKSAIDAVSAANLNSTDVAALHESGPGHQAPLRSLVDLMPGIGGADPNRRSTIKLLHFLCRFTRRDVAYRRMRPTAHNHTPANSIDTRVIGTPALA